MAWTQEELKQKVGDQIKENKTYLKMLEMPDGRRCWTLKYRADSDDQNKKYHMDILPAVVDANFKSKLKEVFSKRDMGAVNSLAIKITDKERLDYFTERIFLLWLKSNPFGYALWFQERAILDNEKRILIEASIQQVPQYQKNKLPLQRVIQILKRQRDMMFSDEKDKEDKPISIIITTLAAKAYNKEKGILEALYNVIHSMDSFIEERWGEQEGKYIKWISNPVNDEENFADKWVEHPLRQTNFYTWLKQVREDISNTIGKQNLALIKESLSNPFGRTAVNKAFINYGDKYLIQRESNELKMAANTGMISSQGRTSIPQHQNFGKNA